MEVIAVKQDFAWRLKLAEDTACRARRTVEQGLQGAYTMFGEQGHTGEGTCTVKVRQASGTSIPCLKRARTAWVQPGLLPYCHASRM